MAEKISASKGFDDTTFDTYVPELEEAADIRNALELFFYGNSEDGNTTGDVSLHATLVDFDTRIDANDAAFDGHTGAISDVHGTGAGNLVVGTGTVQTLSNKTLASPTLTGTATLPATTSIGDVSSTEISYLDGVTSSIQTQINTNTPTGMVSIHAGSSAPTGWFLCDGTSYSTTTYANLFSAIGYTFGGSGSAFAVPNLKGKVVVGIDATQIEFDTRGETGGSMTHQHASTTSSSTSVAHNHTIPALSTNSASNGAGAHNHNVNAHTHNTNSDGDHDHTFEGSVSTSTNGVSQSRTTGNTISTNISNHSHGDNFNPTTTGSHTHTTNNPGTSTSSDGGNHTHAVNTVASATVDGAGGSHTHTIPASDILSNLQPYMALNYIIKF